MASWVAITWENNRLVFLSASASGKSVTFEYAATLDDPKKLGELISKYRLAKAETIVVLNRSDVEVRPMVFPPVPVDELPDLVRFQAGKEFNNYEPNAPVDFFVTSKLENVSRSTLFPAVKKSDAASTPDGAPKHILASTLRLATFQKIKTFCEEYNLALRHIVLRPCATAALWRQSGNSILNRSALLVELDQNETSQTVVLNDGPVFMRSPKLHCPQDVSTPDFVARLLAELKRTRIAVRNEIQGNDVDEVALCGSGVKFELLAKQLSEGLEVPVRLFDPTKGLKVQKLKLEAASERYAPLFGAIQQVIRKEPLPIDFCNPKKRTEDTGKRNLFTGIAAAVLLLVISLFGYTFYNRSVLLADVQALQLQFNELNKTAGVVVEQKKQLDAIDAWLADNVNWFEQLEWLSRSALPAQDMMVRNLVFNSANRGSMNFVTLLRNQTLLAAMEEGLRDTNHDPRVSNLRPETGTSRYGFQCTLTISLSRETENTTSPVRTPNP